MVADSKSGYVSNFEVNTGKDSSKDNCVSGIVLRLLKDFVG